MSNVLDIECIKTGIDGLDEMFEEGIPKGWPIIITGGPGSCKSILSAQFICEGIEKHNESGILVLFEEPFAQVAYTMKKINIDLIKYLEQKKLLIIDASPSPTRLDSDLPVLVWDYLASVMGTEKRGLNLNEFYSLLTDCIREFKPDRLVIDSISALKLYTPSKEFKFELARLFKFLFDYRITAFITAERPDSEDLPIEYYLANGIIVTHYAKRASERFRALEIIKMRGVKHQTKMVPMDISDTGLTIFPEEKVFATD